jgi:nitroreductase
MDVIEAMETGVAMRYLKPDPVPREQLERLIYAATRASNPGNSQGWEFVVIDDPDIKARIGDRVMEGMAPVFRSRPQNLEPVQERMYQGAEHLARNFARVPAWILGCARKIYPPHAPRDVFMYSTIYPAAQNLVVAARSMNIGTAFTTFHGVAEPLIRELLNIPDDVHLCVLIAVGYPERAFSRVRRKPVAEVLHWNGWGAQS